MILCVHYVNTHDRKSSKNNPISGNCLLLVFVQDFMEILSQLVRFCVPFGRHALRPPSSYNPKNPGSDADANSLYLKRVKGLAQRRSLAFEEGVFTEEEDDDLVGALCLRCICLLRLPFRADLYVHLPHAYGFFPVWVLM